jgi:hypothetical protein
VCGFIKSGAIFPVVAARDIPVVVLTADNVTLSLCVCGEVGLL